MHSGFLTAQCIRLKQQEQGTQMKMENKKKPEIDSTTKKYEKIQMENKKKQKIHSTTGL